jgi:hypothetical protein
MRHRRATLITIALLAAIALVPVMSVAVDRDEQQQDAALDRIECTLYQENCATDATAEATATMDHSEAVTLGWHAPGAHDGLNGHEHGDAPPQWVLDSANQPFTQSRESHTGYKAEYAVSPGGAESYLIAHILSTESARAHGDHDYQLWIRDPDTGSVVYTAGVLCFARPCTAPTPERTSDTGQRPIVLGERNASDGCETWYSDPADPLVPIDLGWTICGRYQAFDGTVLGGEGSFRTIDWILPCSILPQGHALRDECRTEFGVSRLSWLSSNQNYGHPAVEPIN